MHNTPVRLATGAVLLALAGCIPVPVPIPVGYPVSYAPEPAPVPTAAGYVGTTCGAGFYVCQVPPGPVGRECSCPGLGAPSFGVIR